jgi:enterobacterial common antigen flippase
VRRDVSVTVGARIVGLVAGLAAAIVTARALGPDGRGVYVLVVTLAAAVVQVSNLGLHAANTRQVAQDRTLLAPLLANSLWISLLLGGVGGLAAAALFGATGYFPEVPPAALWFVAALAPATLFVLLGLNLLVGYGRIGLYSLVDGGAQIAAFVCLLAAALVAADVLGFLAASTVAWVGTSALLLAVLVRLAGGSLRFHRPTFEAGLRFAIKTWILLLLGFLVLRANIFMIKRLYSASELGLYSVAAQAADVLAILPASVGLVLFPALVRERVGSWRSTVRTSVAVGLLLAVACAALGLLARPLVELAFGPAFGPSASMLRWLLPGVLAVGMATVFSQYLSAIGLPRVVLLVWALGVVCVVALGRVLIPAYGGVGAAAGLSATYLLLLGLIFVTAYRYRGVGAGPAA